MRNRRKGHERVQHHDSNMKEVAEPQPQSGRKRRRDWTHLSKEELNALYKRVKQVELAKILGKEKTIAPDMTKRQRDIWEKVDKPTWLADKARVEVELA